jgi:hypothetical protein
MGIARSKVVRTPGGKSRIQFWTSVEVETETDVHVDIDLNDIIDDVIEAMDELQAEEIVKKAGLINKMPELEGEALKRHLCDLTGASYQSDVNQIMNALINKLRNYRLIGLSPLKPP